MRRLICAATLFAASGLSACDESPPIAAEDLHLRITAGATEVELGRGFPLTVVRVWSRDLAPSDWEDRALAPLSVRLLNVSRRENDRRVEETRTYAAYAFALGDVTLPPRAISATPAPDRRSGAAETIRTAASAPLHLRVGPTLDPSAPGEPELPGGPLREPFPWRTAAIVAVAALAATAILVRRARRARPHETNAESAPTPPPGPDVEALARLRAVRDRAASDLPADFVETSAIVREYLAARFDVHAPEMTSEEIAVALARLEASPRALLHDVGARCDLVKFAAAPPTAADRACLLDAAERFVVETAARE
ncbi:MAG: hypothetical protein K8T90_03040 [Planctomycetes bacterium]|nr:hypothetical protein [Planctomycetota bacterium]